MTYAEKIWKGRVQIAIGPRGGFYPKYRWLWEQANGPIPKGFSVHHLDENKLNDNLKNLVLMTTTEHKSYHAKKAVRTKRWCKNISISHLGEKNPMSGATGAKNPAAKPVVNIDTGESFDTVRQAANGNIILASNITAVCMGKRRHAGGYRWQYK